MGSSCLHPCLDVNLLEKPFGKTALQLIKELGSRCSANFISAALIGRKRLKLPDSVYYLEYFDEKRLMRSISKNYSFHDPS